jgi:hypothetical protein
MRRYRKHNPTLFSLPKTATKFRSVLASATSKSTNVVPQASPLPRNRHSLDPNRAKRTRSITFNQLWPLARSSTGPNSEMIGGGQTGYNAPRFLAMRESLAGPTRNPWSPAGAAAFWGGPAAPALGRAAHDPEHKFRMGGPPLAVSQRSEPSQHRDSYTTAWAGALRSSEGCDRMQPIRELASMESSDSRAE